MSILWMSADPKEEEYIHNPIDELWKLTDNQQLSLDQMSCSLKSHKKLDGAHEEKKTNSLWWPSSAKSAARAPV